MTLRDKVPQEFFTEYLNSKAAKFLDKKVEKEFGGFYESDKQWPGSQKNVHIWWILENNIAVGWNENPSKGWSFPVIKMKGLYE